jgi:hypothetical protein
VHASKGFTRLTGWHLHTLVAAQEDHQQQQQQQRRLKPQPKPQQQQQQQGPAADLQAQAQASPLFCTLGNKAEQQDDKGAQRAAVEALLAEADVTGFARSTLWLQTAPAPALVQATLQQEQQPQTQQPFVCRVSVVPVLDRPLPSAAGAGGVPPLARLFVPRLTHLKWTFERAPTRPAAGLLGQQ